jgi:hypothetical protein
VQHAVYEGSRIAALPSTTTETKVQKVVAQATSGIGLAQANVSVTANGGPYTSTGAKGATIVVSASYT